MQPTVDPVLAAVFGSRTRLLTLAVLANAEKPLTGYRVAAVAGLPRPKVYAELRRAKRVGLTRELAAGVVLVDADVRALLRKRVRVRWDEEWDRARAGWSRENRRILVKTLWTIRDRVREDPAFLRPRGWRPPAGSARWQEELRRPRGKDSLLRRLGLRTSTRRDWAA